MNFNELYNQYILKNSNSLNAKNMMTPNAQKLKLNRDCFNKLLLLTLN